VFTRTKHGANRLAEQIGKTGVRTEAIHGNKAQGARQRALAAFKTGEARVLVATDLFARGIDVAEITHVVNFDLPNEPESYVHRIGRTGRAGRTGIAIAFCDPSERAYLADIERLTRVRLTPQALPQGFVAPPPGAQEQGRGGGDPKGHRPPKGGDRGRPQRRRGFQKRAA